MRASDRDAVMLRRLPFSGVPVEDEMIESLRDFLRSWGWTEATIDVRLPQILQACVDVGILVRVRDDGFEITNLLHDEGAWDALQRLLRERHVEGGLPAG